MSKLKRIMGPALLALLFAPVGANAGLIVDTVEQNVFVDWFGSHSYTHDINDDGFSLGSALSATLEVEIADDSNSFFDGGEFIAFIVEGFDFDTGGLTFGTTFLGDLEINALGFLNADGFLDVTITSIFGDFYVGKSTLTVQVPEPATLALLGFGLVGIGMARRRKTA